MYERLTAFLPRIQDIEYGHWIVDQKNDGSLEHPKQFPFVVYDQVVNELESEVYHFLDLHPDLSLTRYGEILEDAGLAWDGNRMHNADVSQLDGLTVMALIVGAIRAERFCDGALLSFFEDGSIKKWLTRLKEIDSSTGC